LWAAAIPLAVNGAEVIGTDVAARRGAVAAMRQLELRAARHTLTDGLILATRDSEELRPYAHVRGVLTQLASRPSGDEADQRILAKQSAAITDDLAARTALARLWARLAAAMEGGRPQIAQRILVDQRMSKGSKLYPALARAHSRVGIAVRRTLDYGLVALREAVLSHATAQGWPVSVTEGKIVVEHLIAVELADDRTTRVQSKRVRSLSWDVVRPVLDSEYERVWGRARREADGFVGDLTALVEARGTDNVRLRDVYEAIQRRRPARPGKLATYYKDEFSADLSVLLSTPAGRGFEFSAIRDSRLAFLVVLPGGSLQQYGFVRLRGPS
jgi:hypothetical protein